MRKEFLQHHFKEPSIILDFTWHSAKLTEIPKKVYYYQYVISHQRKCNYQSFHVSTTNSCKQVPFCCSNITAPSLHVFQCVQQLATDNVVEDKVLLKCTLWFEMAYHFFFFIPQMYRMTLKVDARCHGCHLTLESTGSKKKKKSIRKIFFG